MKDTALKAFIILIPSIPSSIAEYKRLVCSLVQKLLPIIEITVAEIGKRKKDIKDSSGLK